MQRIPHVAVFLDDILITGPTNDEHLLQQTAMLMPAASGEADPPLPAETVLLMEHFESSPVTATHIGRETLRDPVLS